MQTLSYAHARGFLAIGGAATVFVLLVVLCVVGKGGTAGTSIPHTNEERKLQAVSDGTCCLCSCYPGPMLITLGSAFLNASCTINEEDPTDLTTTCNAQTCARATETGKGWCTRVAMVNGEAIDVLTGQPGPPEAVAEYQCNTCSDFGGQIPVSSPPPPLSEPAEPLPPPCFDRETTFACRVANLAVSAASAYAQCFGQAAGLDAERVLMASLASGDRVLASPDLISRIIVNVHRAEITTTAAMLTLETTSGGVVSLTPDHALSLDGFVAAAREARPGNVLATGERLSRVTRRAGGAVINPFTTAGTILAAGSDGPPILATTFSAWFAQWLLDTSVYPVPLSLSNVLSYIFPATSQAYYDAALEPLFVSNQPRLVDAWARLPRVSVIAIVAILDLAIAVGFVAFSATGFGIKFAAALTAVAVASKARRSRSA